MNPARSLRFSPFFLIICFPLAVAIQVTPVAGFGSGEIPIKLLHGTHVMAKGEMGRLKDLTFLIDKGAAITTVDQGVAERLELDCHSLEAASLFSGAESISETMIPGLEFGPVRVGAWQALARVSYGGIRNRVTSLLSTVCRIALYIRKIYSFGIAFVSRASSSNSESSSSS